MYIALFSLSLTQGIRITFSYRLLLARDLSSSLPLSSRNLFGLIII